MNRMSFIRRITFLRHKNEKTWRVFQKQPPIKIFPLVVVILPRTKKRNQRRTYTKRNNNITTKLLWHKKWTMYTSLVPTSRLWEWEREGHAWGAKWNRPELMRKEEKWVGARGQKREKQNFQSLSEIKLLRFERLGLLNFVGIGRSDWTRMGGRTREKYTYYIIMTNWRQVSMRRQ